MARNRRKDGRRDGEEGTKDVKGRPTDTNIEVLPARSHGVEKTKSVQATTEVKKLTGKKRKRLDKYIENKLKKEEAAALIKKLSQRVIDTSSFRSTKTLGQANSTKRQSIPKGRNWDMGTATEDGSEDSGPEDSPSTKNNHIDKEISESTTPNQIEPVTVGAALRKSGDTGFSTISRPRKRRKSDKESWRERLETTRDKLTEDASDETSDGSDSDSISSLSDSEYSEWGGISQDKEPDSTAEREDAANESQDSNIDFKSSESDAESDSESEGSSGTDDSSEKQRQTENLRQHAKGFTTWAREQSGLGETISNIDSLPQLTTEQRRAIIEAREAAPPPSLPVPEPAAIQQTYFVSVQRDISIQESRLSLPIIAEEQRIMEALSSNDCVVICGETGSGKTTQLPQFLYEAGYGSSESGRPGMIGVTQPRRVAAVSMSSRVAQELGPQHAKRVGYQIRFDAKMSDDTAIKFMTDGVLLREVALDLLLSKYSAVIVDEAHERSVNTDVLIGVLSRVVKLRREMSTEKDSTVKPLKLIIMSATMRVTDFTANTRLFPQPPPVINVDARQYPVDIHFNKRTVLRDYVDEAFKKVSKIHKKLPPGGILVFLTGQDEIRNLCNKLRERFPPKSKSRLEESNWNPRVKLSAKQMDMETEDVDVENDNDDEEVDGHEDDLDASDDSDIEGLLEDDELNSEPLHILPLFSLLPVADQLRVFQPPPEGTRLCVVATNIAETSLTIPGIKYVVDCGRVKERVYDKSTGVESFQIGWISKASAAQRTGRAGRTGPGHCYRLYSSAVFERDFAQFSEPEILKYPIEGIVLQMKGMHIEKIVDFPFPTPPNRDSLNQAEKVLEYLGAVDKNRRITPIGRFMSAFPLHPRYAKMIILGQQFDNMPYIIAIVAGLSVGDPFIRLEELDDFGSEDAERSEEIRISRRKFEESRAQYSGMDPGCDVIMLLCAIGAYEYAGATDAYCEQNFLRSKTMKEIRKLRIQITSIVNNQLEGIVATVDFKANLEPPSSLQIKTIKQTVTAAYLDHIAIRIDLLDPSTPKRHGSRNILRAEYSPITSPGGADAEAHTAFIHPNSALSNISTPPEYIVYSDIRESPATGRLRLLPLTTVAAREIEPLAKGTPLIQYSKPLLYPPPRLLSENGVMKKEVHVVPRFGIHGRGWQLPTIKRVETMGLHCSDMHYILIAGGEDASTVLARIRVDIP